jgi:hypothetical protein
MSIMFMRVDEIVTATTIASNMLTFLRGQHSVHVGKDASRVHTSVHVVTHVVLELDIASGGKKSEHNGRRESSTLVEERASTKAGIMWFFTIGFFIVFF